MKPSVYYGFWVSDGKFPSSEEVKNFLSPFGIIQHLDIGQCGGMADFEWGPNSMIHTPLASRSSSVAMCGSIQLTNEVELRKICGVPEGTAEEIVKAGYRFFGINFFSHLRGSFAFAILDHTKNELVLVRDSIGLVPIYIAFRDSCVVWSSSSRLLAASGTTASWNVDYLVDFLSDVPLSPYETALQGVYQLPAGACLIADSMDQRIRRWWKSTPIGRVDSATALGEFERIFLNSIADELERIDRDHLAVRLSGGYDSSCILLGMVLLGLPVRAATVVFPGEKCNEQRYVEFLSSKYASEIIYVLASDGEKKSLIRSAGPYLGPLLDPYEEEMGALSQACKSRGWQTLFTGMYGDEFMRGFAPLEDLEAWLGGEVLRRRHGYQLPSGLLNESGRNRFVEGFLRHLEPPDEFEFDSLNVQLGWGSAVYSEFLYDAGVGHSIEMKHPFLTQSMVEFSSRLPAEYKTTDVMLKPLLAQFLAKYGLHLIAERNEKADLSEYFRRCYLPALVRDLRSKCTYELIEATEIFDMRAVDEVVNCDAYSLSDCKSRDKVDEIWRLWQVVMLMRGGLT